MNVDIMNTVRQALGEIIDPETGLNIMRMDLIQDLSVDDAGRLSLTFRPSSPVCPMAYTLGNEIKKKLGELQDITSINITSVWNSQRTSRGNREKLGRDCLFTL